MIAKYAAFSECRRYRYMLARIWSQKKPFCLFVCLNPSTADEQTDDPTIRRCIGFAESQGASGMVMVNLFAYRSTDRSQLDKVSDPVGPENDYWIKKYSELSSLTIIAWGNDGSLNKRDQEVLPLLKNPHCLGVTKAGHPRHPLYLRKNTRSQPYFMNGGSYEQ